MATVIKLKGKKRSKPITDAEQFEYAEYTGCCPKCGAALKLIHTCKSCGRVELTCHCGWGVAKYL